VSTKTSAPPPAAAGPFQNFTVRFRAGESVFREGDPGSTMFIVQAGQVRLWRDAAGQRQALGLLEKGDFFGEMSILEGLPRTASAEAVEDSELIEINSNVFDKMIRGNIEIAVRMLRKLSIRLRDVESRLARPVGEEPRGVPLRSAGPAPGAAAGGAPPGARLETDGGACYALEQRETLVGRFDPVTEQRPDVDLTELDLKRTVSRRHARIVQGPEGHTITEEIGALNGTAVNGTRLVAGRPHPIRDGDRLGLGSVTLVFRA